MIQKNKILETGNYLKTIIQASTDTNSLNTFINDKKISIISCQFETDACYESKNIILLIEILLLYEII